MGMFSGLELSIAGMDVQQARLNVATANIANAGAMRTNGARPYVPLEVAVRTAIDPGSGLPRPFVGPPVEAAGPSTNLDGMGGASARSADLTGRHAADSVGAMLDLMQISRAYEANVRAFDVSRALITKTLELWSSK